MALVLRETKGSPLTFEEMDGNLTYLEGRGFPFTGTASIDGALNIDFTDTLDFFTQNITVPFGQININPFGWIDIAFTGDAIGSRLVSDDHISYQLSGSGDAELQGLGVSLPVEISGNILSVTSGGLSGSGMSNTVGIIDQSGLGGELQYINQMNSTFIDPSNGDRTQYSMGHSGATAGNDSFISMQNDAGESIDLNLNNGHSGFSVFNDLSDDTASLFRVTDNGNGPSSPNLTQIIEFFNNNVESELILSYDFADDAAAALGGVSIGGFYHNNGALRIRTV